MKNKLMGLFKDDEGQAMTEYGLIIALVAVVVVAALALLGNTLNDKFGEINEQLAPAAPPV